MLSNSFIFNIYPILTQQDRKRLGINKSTLWYIQKYIKEGKKVKIYGKIVNKLDE